MELKDDDHWHTRIAYALELSRVLPSSGEFLVAAGSCQQSTAHDNEIKAEVQLNLAPSGTSYSPVYYAALPNNIRLYKHEP